MKLYNTLSRSKEIFSPDPKYKIKIYLCGPTVYDYIHIGNARPICVFDVLRRYLEYKGYEVLFVQNFTDIDDKIIKKAADKQQEHKTIATFFQKEYEKDAEGLGIKPATIHPKATEHIDEIIKFIVTLLKKNYAYETDTGNVYFRTAKFAEYGKLSGQSLNDLESGARIAIDETKENPVDFTLWKAAKPGEPYWHSPWGKGRPGWHIECSAMVKKYLGETIDIHCGGQDLIFPHHENEIAQSESESGKLLAKFWLHNGYINIDNKKMSKSLGNFFTVREVAKEFGYEPIRYLMIASQYRSPINYSQDIIKQSAAALDRLYNCKNNLDFWLKTASKQKCENDELLKEKFISYKEHFLEAMDDDLNTAGALSALFDLTRLINTEFDSAEGRCKNLVLFAKELFFELTGILGILGHEQKISIDDAVRRLIEQRETARLNKDWQTADNIRNKLSAMGIALEDTSTGTKIAKE